MNLLCSNTFMPHISSFLHLDSGAVYNLASHIWQSILRRRGWVKKWTSEYSCVSLWQRRRNWLRHSRRQSRTLHCCLSLYKKNQRSWFLAEQNDYSSNVFCKPVITMYQLFLCCKWRSSGIFLLPHVEACLVVHCGPDCLCGTLSSRWLSPDSSTAGENSIFTVCWDWESRWQVKEGKSRWRTWATSGPSFHSIISSPSSFPSSALPWCHCQWMRVEAWLWPSDTCLSILSSASPSICSHAGRQRFISVHTASPCGTASAK